MNLHVAALPDDFLTRVRERGLDDQLQAVHRYVSAEGGEPCRDALRRARPGEEVILASYCPFTLSGPYKEFGPVFVLANSDAQPVQRGTLPIAASVEDSFLQERFALRAYSHNEWILDSALVMRDAAQEMVERFLARDDVAFVQARYPGHGCFACRIERAPSILS
jgi:Protein of unknown function (DUF1203)